MWLNNNERLLKVFTDLSLTIIYFLVKTAYSDNFYFLLFSVLEEESKGD